MRRLQRKLISVLLFASASAYAQSGLRVPERAEPGLDPSFARGWFAPEFDRFGFAANHWRDGFGTPVPPRMNWSYTFRNRSSLGLSMTGREYDYEQRNVALYGRYWFAPDWAVSAESQSREPTGLLRLQDFRIGVQRRF